MVQRFVARAAIIFVLYLVQINPALAYVDPGSALLLLQGFIAAIGAVLVFMRNPIGTIRKWLKKRWRTNERP